MPQAVGDSTAFKYSISAKTIAMALLLVYGAPRRFFFFIGFQSIFKCFSHVCQILDVTNLLMVTCHSQNNEHVERFNITVTQLLRKYVGSTSGELEIHTSAVTYAFNTQVHCAIWFAPFELLLSYLLQLIAVKLTNHEWQAIRKTKYLRRWQQQIG